MSNHTGTTVPKVVITCDRVQEGLRFRVINQSVKCGKFYGDYFTTSQLEEIKEMRGFSQRYGRCHRFMVEVISEESCVTGIKEDIVSYAKTIKLFIEDNESVSKDAIDLEKDMNKLIGVDNT